MGRGFMRFVFVAALSCASPHTRKTVGAKSRIMNTCTKRVGGGAVVEDSYRVEWITQSWQIGKLSPMD